MLTKQKIPVIFMSTVFGSHNGPGTYAHYLADAFQNDPIIDFHLVVPDTPHKKPNFHCVTKGRNSRTFYSNLQEAALNLANSFDTPPIIHANNSHVLWKLKNYSGPIISQVNDYDAADSLKNPTEKIWKYGLRRYASLVWRRSNERSALNFATRIICNSYFTQNRLIQAYGDSKLTNSTVIYKSVEIKRFNRVINDASIDIELIGNKRILFLGANWHRKGLDIAIYALKKLLSNNPDCSLIVAGKCAQKSDQAIRKLPASLGIRKHVQFLGHVDRKKLPSLFNKCNLLALPSREEALGVAILEALAAGLPVVGSNVGGIPEILGNCEYSVLTKPNDPVSLADAFNSVLSRNIEPAKINEEGIQIAKKFSKSNMINEIKNLYIETEKSRVQNLAKSK